MHAAEIARNLHGRKQPSGWMARCPPGSFFNEKMLPLTQGAWLVRRIARGGHRLQFQGLRGPVGLIWD